MLLGPAQIQKGRVALVRGYDDPTPIKIFDAAGAVVAVVQPLIGTGTILFDKNGNQVVLVDDGGTQRLPVDAKVTGAVLPPNAATETTLEAARVLLASIDGKDFATQTTLATLATETKLEAVRLLLASIDGKDFATETTLATLATETKLEAVRVLLASIDGKDFATQTTLAVVSATLTSLDGKDFATQTTLATLATEAKLEAVRLLLVSLDGKDFATQTTLATLATEAKLEAVRLLLVSLDAKDFATQTTLATLATEAKLEAVRLLLVSIDGKDFATQTTLAAADAKLATIDAVLDSIKDTDGIKKITDPLPAGTNVIGRTGLRSNVKGTAVAADLTSEPVDANTEALHTSPQTLAPDAATETTLAAANVNLADIETILTAIRDTAGIKKITDALPVGDNIIGRVKLTDGTEVADITVHESKNRLEVLDEFIIDRDKVVGVEFAKTGITATTYFILVDISDTTGWKHAAGSTIHIASVGGNGVKNNVNGKWIVQIGVVLAITPSTDATIGFIGPAAVSLQDTTRFTNELNTAKLFPMFANLSHSAGAFTKIAGNLVETDVTIDDTTSIEKAIGGTGNIAVGDMVLRVKAVAATGALDFGYSMLYYVD